MQETPLWFLIVQLLVNVAIIGTFIVYWRQLIAMQGQLTAARESSRSQNLIAIIEYIQKPNNVEARRILISLEGKPLSFWNPEERLHAERACSGWDVVAILLKDGSIPRAKEIIIETWGYSIRKCHNVASEFISEARKSRSKSYWDDFEWLAEEAHKAEA